MNNVEVEKRTKIHIHKLQKALSIHLRETDKKKTALKKFLVKRHKTTGYLNNKKKIEGWWESSWVFAAKLEFEPQDQHKEENRRRQQSSEPHTFITASPLLKNSNQKWTWENMY